MNYALDALWWHLRTPAVRDLAMLLTAPPLWHSGAELPVRTLLGETGFARLCALDEAPAPLLAYLAPRQPFAHRLGFYAEHLLAFWFQAAAHAQLLAHNQALVDANTGQTVGAVDFLVRLNGVLYHLELTCKYYGSASGLPETLVGLNRQDALVNKAAKLAQQSSLLQTEVGQAWWSQQPWADEPVHAATVVRGMAFAPHGLPESASPLNPHAWSGGYVLDWAEYWADQPEEARFALLPPLSWLAPARLHPSQTFSAAEWQPGAHSGLLARLQPRPDGHWHEDARWMKVVAVA